MTVSPPKVLYQTDEAGNKLEPIEEITVDLDEEYSSKIIDSMNRRKGKLIELKDTGKNKKRLIFMDNNLKKSNIYAIYFGSFILILPLIAFFINAFSFRWFYPQLIPKELSLQAWVRLKLIPREGYRSFDGFLDLWLSNPTIIKALVNSVTIGVIVTIVSIIIALPAARVLGLLNFRFKKIIIFIMVMMGLVIFHHCTHQNCLVLLNMQSLERDHRCGRNGYHFHLPS